MKRSAILVNCARGGLVDEAALHRALVDGHLFTAGLDAFSQEPPLGNPLLELDQTVVTPHTAGGTVDNFRSVAGRAVQNTRAVLAGEALPADDVVVEACRSEERRVGKACVSTCRSRWSPYHSKKKHKYEHA